MRKVLIAIEDYNEMLFVESFFKRLGFDTVSIQKITKLLDSVIAFAPNLIVSNYPTKSLPYNETIEKWKKYCSSMSQVPVFLALAKLTSATVDVENLKMFDGVLESPFQIGPAIQTVAELMSLNENILKSKWDTLRQASKDAKQQQRESNEMEFITSSQRRDSFELNHQHIKSGNTSPPIFKINDPNSPSDQGSRFERYQSFLKSQPIHSGKTLSAAAMKQFSKRAAIDTKDMPPDDEDLKAQADSFLKSLFSKD